LAKVELLDLFLGGISLKAAVPQVVMKECCGNKKTLDSMLIQRAIGESRIAVTEVKNTKLVRKLELDSSLGCGKSEVIAPAVTQWATLVAIDYKNGITRANF
jgi:predicted nucleic acid-binding protein